MDELATAAVELGDDDAIRSILKEVCDLTGMGFAALARVTDSRWIACQVEDRIEFGLDPGEELEIQQTICSEIRDCGEAVLFDDGSIDIKWSRHPVPVLYGFRSYCSFPIYLDDGSFYGTLCALDPQPRAVSNERTVAVLTDIAGRIGRLLSARRRA